MSSSVWAQTVLVFGDSLSAGYGLTAGQEWPKLLEQRLAQAGYAQAQVVNASISGETSAGGLARLPAALQQHRPTVVVLELGANDGLQGKSLAQLEQNLSRMVTLAQAEQAKVLLVGNHIPPNYGPRYGQQFFQTYARVAKKHRTALVPFMLDGVALKPDWMQGDGVHPKAEAQAHILGTIWPGLQPLLPAPSRRKK